MIWFQAAPSSKATQAPAGHSAKHTKCSVKRKKPSAQHKKHSAFQCRKSAFGKAEKKEVCCPLCEKTLPGDNGLLDHFAQRLCTKDQRSSTCSRNPDASKADIDHSKTASSVHCSDGPALASIGPEAGNDGPSASSRRKDITHSKHKFSYTMEAGLEKVNLSHSLFYSI